MWELPPSLSRLVHRVSDSANDWKEQIEFLATQLPGQSSERSEKIRFNAAPRYRQRMRRFGATVSLKPNVYPVPIRLREVRSHD
jgi:hypothetical protein